MKRLISAAMALLLPGSALLLPACGSSDKPKNTSAETTLATN